MVPLRAHSKKAPELPASRTAPNRKSLDETEKNQKNQTIDQMRMLDKTQIGDRDLARALVFLVFFSFLESFSV